MLAFARDPCFPANWEEPVQSTSQEERGHNKPFIRTKKVLRWNIYRGGTEIRILSACFETLVLPERTDRKIRFPRALIQNARFGIEGNRLCTWLHAALVPCPDQEYDPPPDEEVQDSHGQVGEELDQDQLGPKVVVLEVLGRLPKLERKQRII